MAALSALHASTPPALQWNDSALSALYTNQIGIYTDATYTYVGFQVTHVISKNKGTAVFFQ